MNNPANTLSFSKSILSGLLTGIIAAVFNLIYTIVYRESADFSTAKIIMPLSIFLGFPILLMVAGYIFFLIKKHLHAGTGWFVFFSLALLAALIAVTLLDTRKDQNGLFSGVRGLCLGLEIITCLLAAFLIPFFAQHPKIYE